MRSAAAGECVCVCILPLFVISLVHCAFVLWFVYLFVTYFIISIHEMYILFHEKIKMNKKVFVHTSEGLSLERCGGVCSECSGAGCCVCVCVCWRVLF